MLYDKISFTDIIKPVREASHKVEESSGLLVSYKSGRTIATLDPGASWPSTIAPQQTVFLLLSFYPGPRYPLFTGVGGFSKRPDGTTIDVASGKEGENFWYVSYPNINANWYINERIDDRKISIGSCRAVVKESYIFGYASAPYNKKTVYIEKKMWEYPYPEIPNVG